MEWLFLLIAVCPAIYMAFRNKKKESTVGEITVSFAEWFYEITFLNLISLYLRGWNDFAFERISVQFLIKYMISSIIFTAVLFYGKSLWKFLEKIE